MNLLFVYPHAIIPNRGGTERVTHTVASALRERGHNIFFMATKSGEEDVYLSSHPEHILISENLSTEERKQAVLSACAEHQIDILINEGGEFEDFAIFSNQVLQNVKIITCLHFDVYGEIKYFRRDHQYKNQTTSRIKRTIIDLCTFLGVDPYRIKFYMDKKAKFTKMLTVSDAVVVVTPIIAEQLKKITGINSNKIVSILNPVPFTGKKAKYDSSLKEKLLLYVGRFSPDKNVDKILKAWARLAPKYPNWRLEIAGDGEMRDTLHNIAKGLQIPRVHFHGHVKDMESLYKRAEYVLLASDCESFSCVVLEGLRHGCYPIVFDYPSVPVVIPHKKMGAIVKQHTTGALARAINKAIATGSSNQHNITDIDQHLRQFDVTSLTTTWQKLLQRLKPSKHSTS